MRLSFIAPPRLRTVGAVLSGLCLALSLILCLTLTTAAPGTARPGSPPAGLTLPIPQDPGATAVTAYHGHPARARPIRSPFAPRHPFMAANGRSNLHDDAYQSDAGVAAGPLGRHPSVTSTLFTQECASVTFDREGRLLTVCVGLATVDLRLLDPQTLEVLADYPLPPRPASSASHPFTAFGGGGYFYLDQHDRAVVPTSQGTIQVIKESGTDQAPALTLVKEYDVSAQVGSGLILSALPDWDGRIWYVTDTGVVGVVDPESGATRARTLTGETIGNSIAVDETGAVFVVSDRALYRFHAGAAASPDALRPRISWRTPYDAGTRQKPGQSQTGSGTTPTVIRRHGHHYVAITDNADPRMHVLVYDVAAPRRPMCKVAVFPKRRSATDNSLIAVGRGLVVENNYGYTGPEQVPPSSNLQRNTPTTVPGLARIDVDYRHGRCHRAWTNTHVRVPTSVSKVSAATGLLYVYEHPAADEVRYTDGEPATGPEDPWYLTALDARTGHRVWSQLTGVGLGYNNNYAPITFGPDGTAYVGVLGGLVAVRDTR